MTLSARFALAMVFLVVVTTFALSLITYYFVTEAVIPRGLDRLATEAGIGANTIEDAVYPTAFIDAEGKPFSSDSRYLLHFSKDQIPPVRAFWSLTMYNEKQLLAANPIDRFAIGDRDKLAFNPDGSLDLYIQRESPGKDKESNWLPAPASGSFTMNMRLYWPKAEVLDGTWSPPGVTQVK
jgi:hypothetical protein